MSSEYYYEVFKITNHIDWIYALRICMFDIIKNSKLEKQNVV